MTVFVKDLNDFVAVNEVYGAFLMSITSKTTLLVLVLKSHVYQKMSVSKSKLLQYANNA